MSKRSLPQSFVCEGCGLLVTPAPTPANDRRKRYCSPSCKLRAWTARECKKRTLQCKGCGKAFIGYGVVYCSSTCLKKFQPRPKPQLVQQITLICVQCGKAFSCKPGKQPKSVTCSRVCLHAQHRVKLVGKKYRPWSSYQRTCVRCCRVFTTKHKTSKGLCPRCVRAVDPNRDHGRVERRAKKAGVPYVYGIKPEQVCARDGWRCHLCGCSTPKRLRGKNQPRSPEVDHILPISAGGGHTWDNVACACRSCNMKKNAKPLGQMRLAVEVPRSGGIQNDF